MLQGPMLRNQLIDTLLNGRDPYLGFNAQRYRPDMQGWNSRHELLQTTIETARPGVILEVGVWKGGSVVFMAEQIKKLSLASQVIAVDTWLGSWEHYEQPEAFAGLIMENGYPSLFKTFLTNVVEQGVSDVVIPLPLDSANAAFVLQRRNLSIDMLHIDAGHDYEAVLADLRRWWPLLAPGGWLVADDYDPDGKVWPTVKEGVDAFLRETAHENFEAIPYKARFRKPA
jgi:predicted O-methyltransferase YrrM